ncbi:MAG: PEP-CTERM sorting domain-containing protein, partial [Candidatus Rokubacteria bacterium]|nr:PEP-CTERM sorting domain-containing protein [Candidatus Rokubacteria bacterium]
MSKKKRTLVALLIGGLLLVPAWQGAEASLAPFQTYVGNFMPSTDGGGSTGQTYSLQANAIAGATVEAAYLYAATFDFGIPPISTPAGTTLNGSAVAFGPKVPNSTACCGIASFRADVTSIVKPVIDGGLGGLYNFAVVEGSGAMDGTALVVVLKHASFPTASVNISDGFASVTGDSTAVNFADPLHPGDAGFFAEMRLGIGFSCCSQKSTVTVNGTLITINAGNNDDGLGSIDNGQLITMGGDGDPFSALLPSYANDHERYNLVPQITDGDTTINILTANASKDDNIFLGVFYVTGVAGFNEPPPPPPCDNPPCVPAVPAPASLILLGTGLVGAAVTWRRRASR